MCRDGLTKGHMPQGPPHIKGPPAPHKNDHVLKMMNQNSVELQPVLLLLKAYFSLWGSPAVAAVRPVLDSRRPFCNHCSRPFCSRPFCSRPFCNRRLRKIEPNFDSSFSKHDRFCQSTACQSHENVRHNFNKLFVTDMMVMSISQMG